MPWASGEKAMQPTPVSPVLGERLEVRVVQLYKIHCTAKPTAAICGGASTFAAWDLPTRSGEPGVPQAPDRRKDYAVSQDQTTQQDPTEQHAAPGSGAETVEYPGRSGEMDVQPDHGEQTYKGSNRLMGKKTIITGGDSGIGRAVALVFAREGADVSSRTWSRRRRTPRKRCG
jgi:hypothetical protein